MKACFRLNIATIFLLLTFNSGVAKDPEVKTIDVNVVNTPDVNIANIPGIVIQNSQSQPVPVEITNGEDGEDVVTIRLSGIFDPDPNLACCLVNPETGFIPSIPLDQFSPKRLIIEYVSCQLLLQIQEPVNFFLGSSEVNGQDAPWDMVVPIELTGPHYRAMSSDGISGWAYHANHQVKVILQPFPLLLVGRREVGSEGGLGRASCIVTGRLVD